MAMFLLHIAFLLALALVAAGLVLWHQGRQVAAGPLRIASVVLIAGPALSAICVAYYGIRYQVQGDFAHAFAVHRPMGMGCMEGGGMMERRHGSMRPGAAGEMPAPPAPLEPSEHESHHPEGAASP